MKRWLILYVFLPSIESIFGPGACGDDMNLFVSIFGGMLLTVILFSTVRVMKLSSFWAAVIAAGLPSLAYMIYSVAAWPGLDVLTMHVVAFPTVALLLFQMGGMKDAPQAKIHWVPKLLVAFFVVITGVLGTFVYIAGNGVPPSVAQWLLPNVEGKLIYTGFAGVVAHGGEASKSISSHRKMESKLARLGWNVEVSGVDVLRPDYVSEVKVLLTDNEGHPVSDVTVALLLGRPGQPVERRFPLVDTGSSGYRAQILLPAAGAWLAKLTLAQGDELIVFERALGKE